MQISNNINSPNFKTGLSSKILLQEKVISPQKVERFFINNCGVEANFLESKSSALANKLCAKIFQQLFEVLKVTV